jgi:hypothetical protein
VNNLQHYHSRYFCKQFFCSANQDLHFAAAASLKIIHVGVRHNFLPAVQSHLFIFCCALNMKFIFGSRPTSLEAYDKNHQRESKIITDLKERETKNGI